MDLNQIFEERYSVRKFKDEKIDADLIDEILLSGMKAPTGKNHQPQRIYVINSEEALDKIKSVCKCIFDAPLVFLVCYNRNEAWHSRFEEGYTCGEMDVTIVSTYMMLKAWELGIGSCWVRYFDSKKVSEAFDLPPEIIPACILDFGYAAEDCKPLETMHNKPRPIDEIVSYI